MRELADTLTSWIDEGRRFALAFVIDTAGSSPRSLGAVMAVREDGLISGSVSGGCVEGSVLQAALRSLREGCGERLEFGSESESVLWEVGLSCGGQISVWVEPFPNVEPEFSELLAMAAAGEATALAVPMRALSRGRAFRWDGVWKGDADLVSQLPRGDLESSATIDSPEGPIFISVSPRPPTLVAIGAVHITVPLVKFARELGFRTIVVDPRSVFATPERFAIPPDRLLCEWPDRVLDGIPLDESTFVVTLSHDPKIDDPALVIALKSRAAYVGALGGAKTQAKKREALAERGVTSAQLQRLHGPVGLNIGAHSPEEIALSILAQIVETRRKAAAP